MMDGGMLCQTKQLYNPHSKHSVQVKLRYYEGVNGLIAPK